jgi:putative restriction endonuclease
MSTTPCFSDADWDFPFFKILPSNDTASAPGHQGGMVIPKDIRPYFPQLSGKMTEEKPTTDESIRAALVVNGNYIGTVSTRYQYQS